MRKGRTGISNIFPNPASPTNIYQPYLVFSIPCYPSLRPVSQEKQYFILQNSVESTSSFAIVSFWIWCHGPFRMWLNFGKVEWKKPCSETSTSPRGWHGGQVPPPFFCYVIMRKKYVQTTSPLKQVNRSITKGLPKTMCHQDCVKYDKIMFMFLSGQQMSLYGSQLVRRWLMYMEWPILKARSQQDIHPAIHPK